MIKLFITGQKLIAESSLIVTDTIDYLEALATFRTKDWDGAVKWLHLSNGAEEYNLLFENDFITKDKHLNLTTGEWILFVHGTKDNTRITTNEVTITVEKTGILDGEPLPDIPLSESEQIAQNAQNALDVAESVREDADNGYFNGISPHIGGNGNWFVGNEDTGTKAQGEKGDRGEKGEQGEQGPQGIQGVKGDPGDATMADIVSVSEAMQTAYAYILQGRNLLHDTNKGVTGWHYSQYQGAESSLEEYGNGIKLTLKKAPTEWHFLSFNIQKALPKLKPNTMYVLSLDLTCNTTEGISFQIMRGSATGRIADSGWIFPKGNEVVEHLVIPLKTSDFTEALDTQVLYVGVPKATGACLAIENMKLEQGYNSTPWCPAPEDVIGDLPELTEATAKVFDVVEQHVLDQREEWITIVDITTTEDVVNFDFTADSEGNSFVCKEIRGQVIFPSKSTVEYGVCMGRTTSTLMYPAGGGASGADGFNFSCRVVDGCFTSYSHSWISGGTHYIVNNYNGNNTRYEKGFTEVLNRFIVSFYATDKPCPAGSIVKVWGLKA